ncbi:hypothetical protein PG997_007393 [Apiospora hydei]|uniref:Uncharacterized protein n=1 Tax=Apiospora hydei TaxID=1337664 RepID=A0ABR1W7V6_9PEZI
MDEAVVRLSRHVRVVGRSDDYAEDLTIQGWAQTCEILTQLGLKPHKDSLECPGVERDGSVSPAVSAEARHDLFETQELGSCFILFANAAC